MVRSSRQGPIPSPLDTLIEDLDSMNDRLRELEAPTGEQLDNALAKLTALVENIQQQLEDFIANDVQAIVDASVAAALAAAFAGNISIGGTLDVAGAVTMQGMRNTDITAEASRVVVWVAGNGKVGHT